MKQQLSLIIIATAAHLMLACSDPRHKEGWTLTWAEEFEQTDGFDKTVWSKIPRGTADWNNYMSDYDSLYAVKDGHLILRGINNHTQKDDTAKYITGGLYTKGKKQFERGRLEIRARLESATGAWPAFWLLPEGKPWPHGGEIDIMEHLNYDTITYQTVHSNYTFNLKIRDPQPGSTNPIDRDGYNTYAVELYADSVVLLVNDKHTITYPRITTDKEGQFPFDAPFYLLLDMQLGGSWVGRVEPKELPVAMYIDWVRFYKKKE